MAGREVELVAATARAYITENGDPIDNIYSHVGLTALLLAKDDLEKGAKKLKRVRNLDGGEKIIAPLTYATETSNTQMIGKWDTVVFTPIETITDTEVDWKNLTQPLVISKQDILKIKGQPSRIDNYVQVKTDGAWMSSITSMNTQLQALSPGGDDFNSLPYYFHKDPTGSTPSATIGGIDQSAGINSWWRNTQGASGASNTYQKVMDEIYGQRLTAMNTAQGDGPDIGICGLETFEYIHRHRVAKGTHDFVPSKVMNLLGWDGTQITHLFGMDVIWDSGVLDLSLGSGTAEDTFYGINSKHFFFAVHEDRNMEISEQIDFMETKGQDAIGLVIQCMGNFVCTNRAKNFVLHGIEKNITS
jgi:hypothetical protein